MGFTHPVLDSTDDNQRRERVWVTKVLVKFVLGIHCAVAVQEQGQPKFPVGVCVYSLSAVLEQTLASWFVAAPRRVFPNGVGELFHMQTADLLAVADFCP